MEYTQLNQAQIVSECDSFTHRRYLQFSKFMDPSRKEMSILDIGCNTGRGGSILRKKFSSAKITGIDVVEDRLKAIPVGIFDDLLCESITKIPLADETFDYIVAGEVIEHIAPDDLEKVIYELKRVLKRNGKLLMTTPNPNAFLVKLGYDGVFQDPSHLSIMSICEHKALLKGAGFNRVKIFGSGKAIKFFPAGIPMMGLFGSYLSVSTKT